VSYNFKLAKARTERPSKCVHMHRSEIAVSERSRLYFNDLPRNGRTIVWFMSHKKGASSFIASFAFGFSLRGSLKCKSSRCQSPVHRAAVQRILRRLDGTRISLGLIHRWRERLSVCKTDEFCSTGIFLAATRMASRDGLGQYDLQDPAVTKDQVRLSARSKTSMNNAWEEMPYSS
jgi:hypothetical protein